jgi:hypothetical protein
MTKHRSGSAGSLKRRATGYGKKLTKRQKYGNAAKKFAGGALGAGVGAYLGGTVKSALGGYKLGSKIGKALATRRKFVETTAGPDGPVRRFKAFRPRIINTWPRGLSHKFERKVKKALEVNDVWGKFIYSANFTIRQALVDTFGSTGVDENGLNLEFFSPLSFQDAQSVMWNAKGPAVNWAATGGNFNDATKMEIVSSVLTLNFKSTSQHTVHIEMYEFRSKTSQQTPPFTLINQSYANVDYANQYRHVAGATVMSLNSLGSQPSDWVEVYKHFHVKKHIVRLVPGGSSNLTLFGPKEKTIDMSKSLVNGVQTLYEPKTKTCVLLFRILNDISISGISADVHNHPAAATGGVAVRYKRTYIMRPPPGQTNVASGVMKNTIWDSYWGKAIGASTDVQIDEDNPISSIVGGL